MTNSQTNWFSIPTAAHESTMSQAYALFHINLAFSSIPASSRPEVIRKCYWPLLRLIQNTGIPLGIELTGWTLKQLSVLDPEWVKTFAGLLKHNQCELIGSGWSQMIGPLIPYEVNVYNQKFGLNAYRDILGVVPRLALVNEMGYSTGMVDVYTDVGYEGIIMDGDNIRLALGLEGAQNQAMPTHAQGCGDKHLPVLWSDSILFQKLQRVVHGDISVSEYMNYVSQRAAGSAQVLAVYSNDAETFDYRPGRFSSESSLNPEGEWLRMERVFDELSTSVRMDWVSPSKALDINNQSTQKWVSKLSSVVYPIPVKKQAKYNISRWAVTGRDDLWLNTVCHRIYENLCQQQLQEDAVWRELCELWASDLRTHITEERWAQARHQAITLLQKFEPPAPLGRAGQSAQTPQGLSPTKMATDGVKITHEEEGIILSVCTSAVDLRLNTRRGLTIASLGYETHNFSPIIGTLSHGYFSSIDLGADFYTGGIVIEMPGERKRITDLEWVQPQTKIYDTEVEISATLAFPFGELVKKVSVGTYEEYVRLTYHFNGWERPMGIIRAGILTLIPESFDSELTVSCTNGGPNSEQFIVDRPCEHGRASSPLVSASAGFGATTGILRIGDESRGLIARWNPSQCAVMPFLQHKQRMFQHLTRVYFSLCELDETSRAGGQLLPFEVVLTPD